MPGRPPPAATHDPGKLARSASGIPVVPVLDGFRGLAVVSIIVFHLMGPTGLGARLPDARISEVLVGALPRGIDVLFVISGFVMFMPTVAQGGRFGNRLTFAVRRAARIVPTYYLCLVLIIGVVTFYSRVPLPSPTPVEIVVHLLFLQGPAVLVDPTLNIGFAIDGALWTISTLVCFYVVLPFIAGIWYRRPWLCLALAAVITAAWREHYQLVAPAAPPSVGEATLTVPQLPYWAFHLAVGMTAALLFVRLHERFSHDRLVRVAPWLQLAAVGGLVAVLFAFAPHSNPSNLLVAAWKGEHSLPFVFAFPVFLAVLMLATALAPGPRKLGLDSRPLRALGDASYGAYMIHLPIFIVIGATLSGTAYLASGALPAIGFWFASVILPSVLFGYLAFRWLEVPIRRRAREWASGRQHGTIERAPQLDSATVAPTPVRAP